jgi:tetratricopeptide (TPR) repeat protein
VAQRGCNRLLAVFFFGTYFLTVAANASPAADQDTQSETHADQAGAFVKAGNLPAAELELRKALESSPRDPEILGNLGTVLAMEKKFEESNQILRQALAIEPDNATLRRYLAANLWQLQEYPEARKELQVILKKTPGDPPTLLLLGMVAENMKDYATAARALASVPSLVRQQPESIAALARSYYHLGSRQRARATLDLLRDRGPQPILLGSKIADEAKDYATATKLLSSIPTTSPDYAEVGYRLALVQYHAGLFEDSQRTLLQLINSRSKSSQIYNLLGWSYEEQRQPAKATDALQEAIRLAPSEESNYLDLGKILLADGSFPAALELARRTVPAFPDSAAALLLQGGAELKVGQFTDAIASYSSALRLDASSADGRLGLAEAQFAADKSTDAAGSFETGMAQFPKDARFPLQYALMLQKQAETGQPEAGVHAEKLLRSALALDPSLAEAHYQLGQIALTKGQTPEALADLQSAEKLDPRSAPIHFALANAYRRLNRKADASKELSLYEKLSERNNPIPAISNPDDHPPN